MARARLVEPPVPAESRLMLGDLIELAHKHGITKHEIDRMNGRGIGFFEAMAAIGDPDRTRPGQDGATVYTRGDIEVAVAPDGAVKSVIDRFENRRTKPRVALTPEQVAARTPRSQVNDEMWALAQHDHPDVRIMYVTPALAGKLLGINNDNRPFKVVTAEEYKGIAAKGKWKGTGPGARDELMHQGVAIDRRGILQDGQHRLWMIRELGIGVWMPVFVGLDPDNFPVVDTGRVRRYADVLGKENFAKSAMLGTVARVVYLYLNNDIGSYNTYSREKVSNDVVLETVMADPAGFEKAVATGLRVEKGVPGTTKTGAAAAYYVIRRANPEHIVDEWFEGLITGEMPIGPDARKEFRKAMGRRDRKKRASAAEHLALLLKTWEAWCQKRVPKLLAWRANETMPAVYRVEREA